MDYNNKLIKPFYLTQMLCVLPQNKYVHVCASLQMSTHFGWCLTNKAYFYVCDLGNKTDSDTDFYETNSSSEL